MDLPFENSRDNGIGKFPIISSGFEPKIDIFPSDSKGSCRLSPPWNSGIPGPGIHGPGKPDFKPDFTPDFTPDFSERFDVENDSVCLALHTLGLSRSEYNSMRLDELKAQRRIDCGTAEIWAWNILAYYKKNSRLFLPDFNSKFDT